MTKVSFLNFLNQEAKEGEEIIIQDLDFEVLKTTRQNIPISTQRQPHCY